MILRRFPLNFSVFFHIAISKNISGIGKKRESLEGTINKLLNPNGSDSLHLNSGTYYWIIQGEHPVPENNLDAVTKCDLYKLAENIISIWLKNEEESVKCIASLLNADLLYLENDQARMNLLEYLQKEHVCSSIIFRHVIDFLRSKGDGNEKIKNTLINLLENCYDDISENPFDLLKWVVSFCRTTPQKISGSQAVVDNIIGILRDDIYPQLRIVEKIKCAQDLLDKKQIDKKQKKSKIKEYFDRLYSSPSDRNNEGKVTNEQVLDTLDSVAEFFLDEDAECVSEREKNKIITKANAVINLAYILHSIAVSCSSEECAPVNKKTNFHKENTNTEVLETYKTVACQIEQRPLQDYVVRVRMLREGKGVDYLVFLLLVLKSYNSDKPIYEKNALEGMLKLSRSFGLDEFEVAESLREPFDQLFWSGIFILQGKKIMTESLQMIGDKSSVENELRTGIGIWRASNTLPPGDYLRYYNDKEGVQIVGPMGAPLH